MTIELVKFGQLLISRPQGREAYLSAKAYLLNNKPDALDLNFAGVKVLTPSWIDEFINLLKNDYPKVKLTFRNTDNPTVAATLAILTPTK